MERDDPRHDMAGGPVSEVMSTPVLAVDIDMLLGDVLATMVRTHVRHLAVVDHSGGCLGVVGDRAVAAAWAASPTTLLTNTVGRILDHRPSVVGIDATLRDVARAMYIDGVDGVAVIDRSGRPVGMITGGDLIAAMANAESDAYRGDGLTPMEPGAP